MNGTFKIKLPEASPSVKSSWLEVGGFEDNGATGAYMDLQINGTALKTGSSIALQGSTTSTDELSSFVYFVNATSTGSNPYNINNNDEFTYTLGMTCRTEACYGQYAKIFVTYSYSKASSTSFLTSNTYFIGNRDAKLTTPNSFTKDFVIHVPFTPTVKSAYLESSMQDEDDVDMTYNVQLGGTNVDYGNNFIDSTGLVFDLVLVKNASSSAASLYNINAADTYFSFTYGLQTNGEDSYRIGARTTITYQYDITPPTYSLNSTNSTLAGTPVSHNLYWQDNAGLSYAIFSFDNCTGTLQNITGMSLSEASAWSNFTVVVNDTVGCTIRWCVYANDTSNNWNGTSCVTPFSYVTTVAYLEVNLITPKPTLTTNVVQNSTFLVNATVFCRAGPCGYVNGTLMYNLTSPYPDTAVNTSYGDKPFFINETPALAMKACSNNPLNADDFCNLTWVVNVTGDVGTDWKLGVYFNSSYTEVQPNSTANATVTITSCTVDFTLQWSSISFGELLPNTYNNSAPGNTNNIYNITVNPGSCNLDFYIRGSDLINSTFNSVIKVGNISWSNISSDIKDGYFSLSESNSIISLNVLENTNITTWYWLSVPPVYAGYYNGTITITGVKNGETP
jgi:hypothetical protein